MYLKNYQTKKLIHLSKGIHSYEYGQYLYIYIYKLNDKQLPPQDAFYTFLNILHCRNEDYKSAHDVSYTFHCKILLDYHTLYLRVDVWLLTDI